MSKTTKIVIIFSMLALASIIGAGIVIGIFFGTGKDFSTSANVFGGKVKT
ncbi:MAG: hypothetical protein ACOX8Q_05155 [Christensenellales bacterium]|jgi:hypothetical protein